MIVFLAAAAAAVSVHDVAAYIVSKLGRITALKLQKLVYYCQAWSLVWDDGPLFQEDVEAWANGPVVAALYVAHRGQYDVGACPQGDAAKLTPVQVETIDAVLKEYGDKQSHWLSNLTHQEEPWKTARVGLAEGERSNRIISHASMAEYYGSLG